jgi:membrane fusion protein, multidrug efflux system
MKRPILLTTLLAAGLLASAFLFAVRRSGDASGPVLAANRPATPVVVAEVREREFVDILEALGTARANESVEIVATLEERIAEIHFDDGDMAAAGQVLVTLESDEERSRLQEARAVLEEQRLRHERSRNLLQRRATSRAQVEEEERLLRVAEARVANIEARLRNYTLRAPFAGVLGFRRASPGAVVDSGTPITTLDDIARVKVDFSVPEKYVGLLASDMTVTARSAAYPDRIFHGRIRTVNSRIDPVTRSVEVRAVVDNPELTLKPGMLLTVEVARSRVRSLAIPEESVLMEGDRKYVLVVDETDTVRRREIETDRREPGLVEVTEGLAAGDRVVVEGTNRVRPGAGVSVVDAPPAAGA